MATMEEAALVRVTGTSTMRYHACLLSVASGHRSNSTGKERDSESGNDYFDARYYSSAMGRFMSPDWAAKAEPVPYAKLDDPQSLNLYAYVRNNPLVRTDPDGHCCDELTFSTEGFDLPPLPNPFHPLVPYPDQYALTPAKLQQAFNEGGAAIWSFESSAFNTVKGWFSKKAPDPGKPGTKGKPDHQATAAEEAEKIGGKPEVRIPTPGGDKETRVGDAVAKDANGNVTAVTQVIRPTPAGNVPLREQKAAKDIQNATGVQPKLVPVRPLPQQ